MVTDHGGPLRIAFLASSGGSVADVVCRAALARFVPAEVVGVVTDRSCRAEQVACDHSVPYERIAWRSTASWSSRVAALLSEWRTDLVVLLFTRRVGEHIWRSPAWAVWNLHESLLPAFKGLAPLRRSFQDAAPDAPRWLGVTVHQATGDLDAGPILAQARFDRAAVTSLEQAAHICFLLKSIVLLDQINRMAREESTRADLGDWLGNWRPRVPASTIIDAVLEFARPWASRLIVGTGVVA